MFILRSYLEKFENMQVYCYDIFLLFDALTLPFSPLNIFLGLSQQNNIAFKQIHLSLFLIFFHDRKTINYSILTFNSDNLFLIVYQILFQSVHYFKFYTYSVSSQKISILESKFDTHYIFLRTKYQKCNRQWHNNMSFGNSFTSKYTK